MKPEKVIAGKHVLIVDDEKDVLDTLVDLLDMCKLDTASSFSEAKKLLEENPYDIVVLDIILLARPPFFTDFCSKHFSVKSASTRVGHGNWANRKGVPWL